MRILRLDYFVWLICIAAVICGLGALWDYSNKPGLPATAQSLWPTNAHFLRDPNFPTLVMFIHPRCDCSEASMSELNQITAQINSKLNTVIIFVTAPNSDNSWKNTALWAGAKLIPNAQILLDKGALEADRFGAKTSGQVLLYDKQGHLVFSGGITNTRGHLGDSSGKTAVISFVNENRLDHPSTPVFGCVLKDYS
ncbi:MAG: hypothetical protein WCK49_04110 [Myxococcaceae bacterium]